MCIKVLRVRSWQPVVRAASSFSESGPGKLEGPRIGGISNEHSGDQVFPLGLVWCVKGKASPLAIGWPALGTHPSLPGEAEQGLGLDDTGSWGRLGVTTSPAAHIPTGLRTGAWVPIQANRQSKHLLRTWQGLPVHFGVFLSLKPVLDLGSVLLTFPNMRKSRGRSQVSARLCRESLYHFCQIHHNSLVLPYIFLNVTEYSAVINWILSNLTA